MERDVPTPVEWTAGETGEGKIGEEWWKDFGEAGLDHAVDVALSRNYDLQTTAARVGQALAPLQGVA